MEIVREELFHEWTATHDIDSSSSLPRFEDDIPFRVPLSDYELQLDTRLDRVFDLLNWDSGAWVVKPQPWNFEKPPSFLMQERMLYATMQAIGITSNARVLLLNPNERMLAQVLAYLTNRWGHDLDDSLYILPLKEPGYVIDCCASRESVFVRARTQKVHDIAVQYLREKKVPAFGPFIKSPYVQEPYQDREWMGKAIPVDRKTGKLLGAGSSMAALKPEFREPRNNDTETGCS
jgi:hypothetical protein